jgi:hypothetical protein
MRRITRFALAAAVAAALGAGSLMPARVERASALDFWSWDGNAAADGGNDQKGNDKPSNQTAPTTSQDTGGSNHHGGR